VHGRLRLVSNLVPVGVFQASIAVFFWLLAINAWREGHRWLATMLWGIVFGFVVEWLNLHMGDPMYEYPACAGSSSIVSFRSGTLCTTDIAAWVPVGWGEVLYLSTWTAQRLKIPPWARPMAAAYMAVNFDLSLDPTAQALGLWCWNPIDVNLFNVPFNNFLGWYLVVAVYALLARWGLSKFAPQGPGPRRGAMDFLLTGVAAALASFVFWLVKQIVAWAGAAQKDVTGRDTAIVFVVVAVVAGVFTWFHVMRSRRDHPFNWAPVIVPAYMSVVCLVLIIALGPWAKEGAVVAFLLANLVLGLLLAAWPSLDVLTA